MSSSRPGRTIENAIKILASEGCAGVAAEYRLIDSLFGRRNEGWEFSGQRLLLHADRHYDEITVILPDGRPKVFYFDVSSFLPRQRRFRQPNTLSLPDDGTVFVVALP
jgi:hypothetical protein